MKTHTKKKDKVVLVVFALVLFISTLLSAQISFEKSIATSSSDEVVRVLLTHENRYTLLVNSASDIGGSYGFNLLNIDSIGNIVWEKSHDFDKAVSFHKTHQNGYIILGEKRLTNVDTFGDTIWTSMLNSDFISGKGNSITELTNKDFLIAGGFPFDLNVVKFSSNGVKTWDKVIPQWHSVKGVGVVQADDSTSITFSYQTCVGHGCDENGLFLAKINNDNGDSLWTKTYKNVWGSYLIKSDVDGFVLCGNTLNQNIYMLKFDSKGNIIFEKTFNTGQPSSIKKTFDNGYIMTGFTPENNHDVFLLKTDSEGNVEFYRTFGDENFQDGIDVVQVENDSSYFICANTALSDSSNRDLLFIKTDSRGMISSAKHFTLTLKQSYLGQNYPNPFNPSTTISYSLSQSGFVKLKVYDVLGREVANLVSMEQSTGNYKVEFNASNLTSGIYFYRLQSGDFTETKKLILLR